MTAHRPWRAVRALTAEGSRAVCPHARQIRVWSTRRGFQKLGAGDFGITTGIEQNTGRIAQDDGSKDRTVEVDQGGRLVQQSVGTCRIAFELRHWRRSATGHATRADNG